jgi:hypothetical protein
MATELKRTLDIIQNKLKECNQHQRDITRRVYYDRDGHVKWALFCLFIHTLAIDGYENYATSRI